MRDVIVVERAFDAPVDPAALQAREDAVAWCLEQHGVRFLRSYAALDRLAMVCLYGAPDAEAVRATQRTAGLPVARAWPAQVLEISAPERAAAPPQVTVLVVRELPVAVTAEYVVAMYASGGSCLGLHRVTPLSSLLARDGRRMACAFAAPDAESVRIANRQAGFPLTSVWTVSELAAR